MPVGGKPPGRRWLNAASWLAPACLRQRARRLLNQTWGTESRVLSPQPGFRQGAEAQLEPGPCAITLRPASVLLRGEPHLAAAQDSLRSTFMGRIPFCPQDLTTQGRSRCYDPHFTDGQTGLPTWQGGPSDSQPSALSIMMRLNRKKSGTLVSGILNHHV